jgi:hypothetical protein
MNRIKLDQALADRLLTLLNDVKRSRYKLAKVISDVRSQYLDAQTRKYTQEFREFWDKFRMNQSFGSLSQFTKYAAAGDVIEWVRENKPEALSSLPNSIKSLYEMSQLEPVERHRLLEAAVPEVSKSKQKSTEPLVQPGLSATAISAWKKRDLAPPPSSTNPAPIKVAELFIHGSFGSYAEDGTYLGKLDVARLSEIMDVVRASLERYDPSVVWVNSFSDELLKRNQAAEQRALAKTRGTKGLSERRVQTLLLPLLKKNNEEIENSLIPMSLADEVMRLGIQIVMRDGLYPGSKKNYNAFIFEPSVKEFRYRLAEEYISLVGAKRFLALVNRARGKGAWKDTKTYFNNSVVKDRDPTTGAVTEKNRRKLVVDSALEKELRDIKKKIKSGLYDSEEVEEMKRRLQEINLISQNDIGDNAVESADEEAKKVLNALKQ